MSRLAFGFGYGPPYGEAAGTRVAPPTNITWAGTPTVAEDAALGTVVGGALSATDPNGSATFTFRMVNDANGKFAISGTSIVVSGALDYETATSHSITVRVSNQGGAVFEKAFTITVTAVAETPSTNPPPVGVIVAPPIDFINPPVVTDVAGGVTIHGKKALAAGKFIYDLGVPVAGQLYTMRYDPDFSLLANQGKTAMVGFGLKQGNNFHLTGLKGDGSTGLKAYEIYGEKWNQLTEYAVSDGGAALAGTQAGPNWVQYEIAANGSSYTMRTGTSATDTPPTTWSDEFTDLFPIPLNAVTSYGSFGVGVFFEAADAGSFAVQIRMWITGAIVVAATDPYISNVVLLVGFGGADGATTFADESPVGRTLTNVNSVVVDDGQSKFGGTSGFFTTTDRYISAADHDDWRLSAANSDQFTIEFWVRFQGILDYQYILQQFTSPSNLGWLVYKNATTHEMVFSLSTDGSSWTTTLMTTGFAVAADTWYHVAVEKNSSGKIRIYVDGVMRANTTPANSAMFNSTAVLQIGSYGSGGFNQLTGWLDELRITKGAARYNSDSGFAVPTAAFPRPVATEPSYFDTLSSGDRTGQITVSTTATLGAGTISNIIDGAYTANASDGFWFTAQSTREIKFTFGAAKVINGFIWAQNDLGSHGTWVLEGSNDDSSYTGIGASFTLGHASVYTSVYSFTNTTAYRYYKLRQTAGTTNTSPWVFEIEFSIGASGGTARDTYEYGDRTSTITTTTTAALGGGAITTLVDGVANAYTLSFTGGQATKEVKFAFGSGVTKTIAGLLWLQSSPANHGTWILEGSNNDSTYTQVGSSFTLGGTTLAVVRATFANTTAYRYYKLRQIAGTTSSGPYLLEVMFNMVATVAAVDASWSMVNLLLSFNGTDAAVATTDASGLANAITFTGNAQLDTANSKFDASSLLLDGTGDLVSAASTTNLDPGSGAFTIEGFVWLNNTTAINQELCSKFTIAANRAFLAYVNETNSTARVSFYAYHNSGVVGSWASTTALTTGVWNHICFERNASNKIRIYVNGVMVQSATGITANMNDTSTFKIGQNLNGWVDEFRFTKGAARYDSDAGFTVPTTPFPRS